MAKKITFEEAVTMGKEAWRLHSEDTTIEVGKSVLIFHEGRLELVIDDFGVCHAIKEGDELAEQ